MAYERFWKKVDKSGECWLWTGALTRGYGQLTHEKRHTYAHRFSWEIAHGKIPAGYVVCHKCDQPRCVNPSHLWIGRQQENVADCISKGRARRRGLRGVNNPSVKVSALDADSIRTLYAEGKGVREIASLFGVSKSTISNIIRGQHWSANHAV